MEEKNITMADMVSRVIRENQLAPGEEDAIWKLIGERKRERDAKRSCICLAEYVEREMDLLVAWQEEIVRKRCRMLGKLCFRESRIGSMDAADLSAADIRKLIILTAETRRMDIKDRLLFMLMLQNALNALAEKGILGFSLSRNIWREYKASTDKVTFIDNPYSLEEVQKIREWVDRNRHDMAGLAAGLWLEAEITADEITALKKEDLMDADGVCIGNPTVVKKNETEDYIAIAGRRGSIIQDALKIHGDRNMEFIFMSEGREGWKKMLARCLPLKMSHICRDIGITYKPFKCTDAIKWCAE